MRGSAGKTPAQMALRGARRGQRRSQALDRQYPIPRATFDTYMQHVMHALDLVGPDHVGVGADWDGGGGVIGMEDVASLPKITERLVKPGYTEAATRQFLGRQCAAGAGQGAGGAQTRLTHHHGRA